MIRYILAATKQEANLYASNNNDMVADGWVYISGPKDLKGLEDATVIVVKGWAKRRCLLMEMMLKTQLSLFNRNSTNTIVYSA